MLNRAVLQPVGAIVAMTLIILIPAIINGFVFTDIDSLSYLKTGLALEIPEDRPVYYSLFTAALGWGINPWPIAIGQCAIVATGIWHVGRVLFGVTDERVPIAIAALLTVASALPWYAAYMMPDIFTALMIVAFMLVAFCWERLNLFERAIYLLLISMSVSFHYSNVPIAFGVNLVFAVLALLGWRCEGKAMPRFIAMNAATLLGVAALFTATTYDHGKVAMSSSSSTFYLARLLGDGSALKVLNEDCPAQPTRWLLCKELSTLNAYAAAHKAGAKGAEMSVTDFFMWSGPRLRLGEFEKIEPVAPKLISEAWRRYPIEQAAATLNNGVRQFGQFWIGNLFDSWGKEEPYPTIVSVFGPEFGQQHLDSLQQKEQLDFDLINIPANILIAVSVLFLVFSACRSPKDRRLWIYVMLALLFFLLGNAFVTGAFSGVFARYQARVIWLVPMIAMLLAARLYWSPKSKAPSTASSVAA